MNEQTPSLSFEDALLIVVRRWRIILGVFVSVVAIAATWIMLLPPQYRAAAKVLLTTDRVAISTSSDRPTELVRTTEVAENELNSQLEILQSRDLIEEVLNGLGVPAVEASADHDSSTFFTTIVNFPRDFLHAAFARFKNADATEPSSPLYWAVLGALKGLEATHIKNTNVVEVAFTGPDPRWASEFVNRLTTAYVERYARLQRITEAEDFFTQQSQLLQKKLAESEAALRALREKAGTLAGQQSEVHDRLNEFGADLARTKIARAEQEERLAFLERMRASAGKEAGIATPELLALEARRADLLGRYRSDSERVRDVEDQIKRLRDAIASYGTITAAPNAASPANGADIIGTRASVAALKGREEALTRQHEEYRRQAELLDSQSVDLARLERQVKLDEEAYLSYVRTAEQSRLSTALEHSKLLRLTILEPATPPLEPTGPTHGRMLSFALVGGLILGMGAGFARDYLDTTLKGPSDVRRYAKLEVLSVLSERG